MNHNREFLYHQNNQCVSAVSTAPAATTDKRNYNEIE